MDKQETILQQLAVVWGEHPEWTFGKLLSIIISMEHLDPRLLYVSDEEIFKRSLHLTKESDGFKIKQLPFKSQHKAVELAAHIADFIMYLEELKLSAKLNDKYEIVLAYALLIDEMQYVKEHLDRL